MLHRFEQNATRDRVVLVAGTALIAAESRAQIYDVVLDAAAQLVKDGGGYAALMARQGDDLVVIATTAPGAGAPRNVPPQVVREAMTTGAMTRTATRKRRLPSWPTPRRDQIPDTVAVSLAPPDETPMALVVTSGSTLSKPVVSGLAAVSATVTLAMRTVALTDRLRRQAYHDSLTGLANRAFLRDRLNDAAGQLALDGGRRALLLLDLDGFKAVNDALGHGAGDDLLVTIAERIQGIVRHDGNTVVARLGGDEFTVLLDGIADDTAAVSVAERILAAVRRPVELHGQQVHVGCSIGIAYGTCGSDPDRLLLDADLAMYQSKAAGKNRCTVFEPTMREQAMAPRPLAS